MKSFSQIAALSEEDYDKMKDRQLERGGMGARSSKAPIGKPNTFGKKPAGKTPLQKDADKKYGAGTSAIDRVKADITAKYGKGAIMKTKKEETDLGEGKKGLWDNIHAKRKRGEAPAKKGSKDYPKTLEVEGYAPGDVDQKVGAVTAIPKKDQDDAKARILAKTKAKRAAKLQKESVFDQVDIFAELNDWEVSLLSDTLIEEIVAEVFVEEMAEGRDIDHVTEMLCESVDYSLSLLTEVTSPAKVNALRLKDKASGAAGTGQTAGRDAGAEARKRLGDKKPEAKPEVGARREKMKAALKSAGSAVKSGLKKAGAAASKGAGYAAGAAGRAAKGAASNFKKGYERGSQGGGSSSTSSDSSGSTSNNSGSSSSSSSEPRTRLRDKIKSGIKKVVGGVARSVSRGARGVARRMGEENTYSWRSEMGLDQ